MKIRVILDGEEIGDDDLALMPRRAAGTADADLWLSLAVGYNQTPPQGDFHIGKKNAAGNPFAHGPAPRSKRPVTPVTISFTPTTAASGTPAGGAPAPKDAWRLEREILLLARWVPRTFLVLFFAAAVLVALFLWVGSEALSTSFGRGESRSSLMDLVSLLLGLGTPAVALAGVRSSGVRRWLARRWCLTLVGVLVLGGGAPLLGRACFVLVVNRTNEVVDEIMGRHTELKPGEYLTLKAGGSLFIEGQVFEECPDSSKQRAPDSLSFMLRRIVVLKVRGACCRRGVAEKAFKAMGAPLPKQKACRPDPEATVPVPHLAAEKAQRALAATYLIQPAVAKQEADLPPFASSDERRRAEARRPEAPTLEVGWPSGATGPYSELAFEGEGFLRETRVKVPIEQSEALPIWLPWRHGYNPLPQLRATLRSGKTEVGTLVCAQPSQGTRVEFLHAGPFVRRLLLQSTQGLAFVSEFDASRPEMVTDIPLCVPEQMAFRIELYLDSGFQPEGWNLRLDGSGPNPRATCHTVGAKSKPCGISTRLQSIQVHLADGSSWGQLKHPHLQRGPNAEQGIFTCPVLAAVRADEASGVINRAEPKEQATNWGWQRLLSASAPEHTREFWVCRNQPAPQGEQYGLTLADGSARLANSSTSGATSVSAYPLRACLLDGNLKELNKAQRDGMKDCLGPKATKPCCAPLKDRFDREQSRDFLSPGCDAGSSQVCVRRPAGTP